MIRVNEENSASLSRSDTKCISDSVRAWSEVHTLEKPVPVCDKISKYTGSLETNNELYLPPELLERIVSYFDGGSMLRFKSLSRTCNEIASNAVRSNTNYWKKCCLKEIPRKYIFDLLNKSSDTFTPLNKLSEIQYEALFKQWFQWQSPVFNITLIGRKRFLGSQEIKKILCHKFDVMIEFAYHKCTFTLIKDDETLEYYRIDQSESKPNNPSTLVILNPRYKERKDGEEVDQFMNCVLTGSIECPIHKFVHDITQTGHIYGDLIDVDMNVYANACCWIRENQYEWYTQVDSDSISRHFYNLLFTSVVHGVIIGWISNNCIFVHNIRRRTSRIIHSWLDKCDTETTALYIYANILFIGTKDGNLLVYRLQCWDDLIHLKRENLLLEIQLHIGQIKKLAIMDFQNLKAIIVVSSTRVVWMKVN